MDSGPETNRLRWDEALSATRDRDLVEEVLGEWRLSRRLPVDGLISALQVLDRAEGQRRQLRGGIRLAAAITLGASWSLGGLVAGGLTLASLLALAWTRTGTGRGLPVISRRWLERMLFRIRHHLDPERPGRLELEFLEGVEPWAALLLPARSGPLLRISCRSGPGAGVGQVSVGLASWGPGEGRVREASLPRGGVWDFPVEEVEEMVAEVLAGEREGAGGRKSKS